LIILKCVPAAFAETHRLLFSATSLSNSYPTT
jgi:hypothetical protein